MKTLLALALLCLSCVPAYADYSDAPEGTCVHLAGTPVGTRECNGTTVDYIVKLINASNGGTWKFVLPDRPPPGGYQKGWGTLNNVTDSGEMEMFLTCVMKMGISFRSATNRVTHLRIRTPQEPLWSGCNDEIETIHESKTSPHP
jgi:hypothetical protein